MRIALVGVGLIGGSIGLAARERLGATVTGYDASSEALELALERGAIDRACGDLGDAVRDAEAAFVAVPVGVLGPAVAAALEGQLERLRRCVVAGDGGAKPLARGEPDRAADQPDADERDPQGFGDELGRG